MAADEAIHQQQKAAERKCRNAAKSQKPFLVMMPASFQFPEILEEGGDMRAVTNDQTGTISSNKQPSTSNPILKGCRPLTAEEVQVSYFPNVPLYLIFPTQ